MSKKQDILSFYYIRYPGSYRGGRAVVRAYDEQSAYQMLKEQNPGVDPFDQCVFQQIHGETIGVLYDWDGDY